MLLHCDVFLRSTRRAGEIPPVLRSIRKRHEMVVAGHNTFSYIVQMLRGIPRSADAPAVGGVQRRRHRDIRR